jgi:hypothetical protein
VGTGIEVVKDSQEVKGVTSVESLDLIIIFATLDWKLTMLDSHCNKSQQDVSTMLGLD